MKWSADPSLPFVANFTTARLVGGRMWIVMQLDTYSWLAIVDPATGRVTHKNRVATPWLTLGNEDLYGQYILVLAGDAAAGALPGAVFSTTETGPNGAPTVVGLMAAPRGCARKNQTSANLWRSAGDQQLYVTIFCDDRQQSSGYKLALNGTVAATWTPHHEARHGFHLQYFSAEGIVLTTNGAHVLVVDPDAMATRSEMLAPDRDDFVAFDYVTCVTDMQDCYALARYRHGGAYVPRRRLGQSVRVRRWVPAGGDAVGGRRRHRQRRLPPVPRQQHPCRRQPSHLAVT